MAENRERLLIFNWFQRLLAKAVPVRFRVSGDSTQYADYTNYITLHSTPLCYRTLNYITTPIQKTQFQPPFSPSVGSLCHPWFTTTNLSYRFPFLKLPPPPCAVLLVKKEIQRERENQIKMMPRWRKASQLAALPPVSSESALLLGFCMQGIRGRHTNFCTTGLALAAWPLTACAKVASCPKPKRTASEGRTKPIQGVFPLTWGCTWVACHLQWHYSLSSNRVSLWLLLLCEFWSCEKPLSTNVSRSENLSQCNATNTLQPCKTKIETVFSHEAWYEAEILSRQKQAALDSSSAMASPTRGQGTPAWKAQVLFRSQKEARRRW